MAHPQPPFATLATFKRFAKQLLKSYRDNPSLSEERIARYCPDDLGPDFKLADAQRVVAREYGFESWPKLKKYLESKHAERLALFRSALRTKQPWRLTQMQTPSPVASRLDMPLKWQ